MLATSEWVVQGGWALNRGAAAQAPGKLGRADEAALVGLLGLARDVQVDDGARREAYESLKRLLSS